jgi:hypothetical protein
MESNKDKPMDAPEKNSKKTVKMWLPKNEYSSGDYIGELYIEGGQFVVIGETDDDTKWLNDRLAKIWVPQSGIPTFKKEDGEFIKDQDSRYISDSYRNHGNCNADVLLESFYDYTRAFGAFKILIEDR